MLDLALATSVVTVAIMTGLLLGLGRRPMAGWRWRAPALVALLAATGLESLTTGSPVPLAIGIAIALVASLGPRRWYAVGALFLPSLLVATVIYSVYLARAVLLLANDPVSLGLGLFLLALELGAMGLILGSAFEMIDAICSAPEAPPLPPAPTGWPVVCLQVPTYNEPPELVIETIRSLVALDYPALRIQVIDNNTNDESLWRPVEAECASLLSQGSRVEFVHLPEWPGYKAGALNWGRTHLDPDVEIVGVVDADYVVAPDWLRSTVPYFTDPRVAFVQTPQDYRAWETSAFYRACYVGFAYFFKVGMVSRAHRNAIIFAGTMGLIRRSVLDEVGGWDERIITEDAEVSFRVLARGYRSVYVQRAFGRGIMPLSYEGLRKQRFRWAFGGIQILRRHGRTIFGRGSGFTLGQRYDHLMGGLWWFNDALTLGFTAFVAASALGAITGRPFVVQRLSGVGLVLPVVLILLTLVRYLWALRATTGAGPVLALAALRVNLSLSWVIALACLRGLTQERGVFLRTPKFAGAAAIREIRLVWVETSIGALSMLLLVLVLARAGFSAVGLVLAGLLAWAALIYGSATSFALGDPARAPIGDVLRSKMALEVAPRVGRVVRSRPARAGLLVGLVGSFALIAVVVSESGRAPVSELPFQEVPAGPVQGPFLGIPQGATAAPVPPNAGATGSPGSSSGPGSGTTHAAGTPGSRSTSSSAPGSSGVPGQSSVPGPTATPTPHPGQTPSIPAPTPTSHPTPASTARPTPSRPAPTPRPA
jgi:cellulose synthase/poly-beta-1,6-N-acetylglucosamine synthase-like glycosyltransferase